MKYKKAEDKIKDIIIKSSNILEEIVEFLYKNFNRHSWIGIYIIKGNDLILGPWKGPNATEHIKIPIDQGICGAAASTGKTEIIPDVNKDIRYLSCFITTKSEIVVPIIKNGEVVGEIDIDSDKKNTFTNEDKVFLEKVADMLSEHI